jgi:RHH-type proline utilization regulon transcriptional repressor/proline dehydrogenase/delta 1-pyrroline-5-carboxylate dehydrogenase
VLSLLDGAMAELRIGLPDDFSTDVGPVIDLAARLRIDAYVDVMRANRHRILSRSLPDECAQGWFVAPTLIEIPSPDDLRQEVFGPVLHVVRYESASLDAVLDAIGAQGYGLTLGIQSRIDDFVQHVIGRMKVGNIYVNRSMIGAVVGVQPFGGEGLSGTGPKAGGPLLLRRLVRGAPPPLVDLPRPVRPLLATLASWVADDGAPLDATLRARLLGSIETYEQASLAGVSLPLPGPTGEVNTLTFHARGTVLGVADSPGGWLLQLAAAVATDNRLLLQEGDDVEAWLRSLPQALRAVVDAHPQALAQPCAAVLLDVPVAQPWRDALARREGPILLCLEPEPDYCLERLIVERCVSVNVTATGGNASLLQLGEA